MANSTRKDRFLDEDFVLETLNTNALYNLLGVSVSSTTFIDTVKDLGLKIEESKTVSGYIYQNCYSEGISFCFTSDETLDSIFLYCNYKKYNEMSDKLKEILPFNLLPKMTIKDVVQLVGEPDKKGGSRMIPIWISYEDMGLQLDFVGSNWEDPNNPLSFVTIFQPLNEKFRVI